MVQGGKARLVHDGGAAVDDDGADAGLVRELARLVVDLAGQLARGAEHERERVGLAAAPRWLRGGHQDVGDDLRRALETRKLSVSRPCRESFKLWMLQLHSPSPFGITHPAHIACT